MPCCGRSQVDDDDDALLDFESGCTDAVGVS